MNFFVLFFVTLALVAQPALGAHEAEATREAKGHTPRVPKSQLAPEPEQHKIGFIDQSGKFLPMDIGGAMEFSEGLAAASKQLDPVPSDDPLKGMKYGYVDKGGKWVIEPQFDEARSFHEGVALVNLGGANERIKESKEQAWEFKGGKWGLIDKSGKWIVKPKFDDASYNGFHEGLCAVKSGMKWGYIDITGRWAIKPRFAYAQDFSDGMAHVTEADD